jgi:hypothetical protein
MPPLTSDPCSRAHQESREPCARTRLAARETSLSSSATTLGT